MTVTRILSAVVLFSASPTNADTFGSGANSFDIEFVTIGNPGNAADTTGNPSPPHPTGSVAKTYRIGKYEISRGMIGKANREGGLGITLADMTNFGGNGRGKPATGVSWFEAVQFVNWLNTSSGSTPAYKFDGNGDFQMWQPNDTGYNSDNLYRNSLARYFLPTVDEWYKAAYYDPVDGVFYDYTTGSDSIPDGIDFPGDTTFDVVFDDGPSNVLYLNDVTDVGLLSPYGTAGQGGNVWEWEETAFDLVNDSISSNRGIRGGGASNGPSYLNTWSRISDPPTEEAGRLGFRVASVPEPSSFLLGAMAAVRLWVRRRSLESNALYPGLLESALREKGRG